MSVEFSYLARKIADADFFDEPFRHLCIDNFLSVEHLEMLTTDAQIRRPPALNTETLIRDLQQAGWAVEPFPGCTDSVETYLACLQTNSWPADARKRVEGFGIAFRLKQYGNPKMAELIAYLNSPGFQRTIEAKLGVSRPSRIETAIQKYLTGYEISPHPDIRSKSATYLLNINTSPRADALDIHTHLLVLKPEKRFIYEFWKYNSAWDRDWVPWDWCETRKRICRNNSIVMFAPSDDSLHAVKLRYDHLPFQRTQIYGNLWQANLDRPLPQVPYERFDISPR